MQPTTETAAEKMLTALNWATAHIANDASPQADTVRKMADDARACYAESQRQPLVIRVCGEPARLALCDVLKGWTARRLGASAWHEIRTTASAHHVRGLISDLRIRAVVRVAT